MTVYSTTGAVNNRRKVDGAGAPTNVAGTAAPPSESNNFYIAAAGMENGAHYEFHWTATARF